MAENTDDRTVIELGVESRTPGRRVGALELTRQENRGGLRLGHAQLRVERGGGRE